jgi:hypothetical protein
MNSRLSFTVFGLAIAALGSPACSKSAGPTPPTTVSGALALSTFPAQAQGVVAVDETGRSAMSAVGTGGAFSLALSKGHTYRLGVVTATGTVPIVYPRSTGRLDATFAVHTAGARVALGTVHELPAAPAGGFHVMSTTLGGASPDAQSSQSPGGDCVDCVNDDQQTSCQDGSDGEQSDDGTSTGGDAGAGASSSGANDTADQADPSQELAVGDQNAPDQVQGCDAESGDDDQVEQEGQN